jgi:hypothetical protein
VFSAGGAAGGRVRPVQILLVEYKHYIFTCISQVNPTALQQFDGPLGLVVKRITSMTSESANDKIARSIRAEGILFCRASFCFGLKRITNYSGVEITRSLVRFWRRASFCVGGVHFELSSAEIADVERVQREIHMLLHQNNRQIQRLLQGHPCVQCMACMQALRCSSVCLPVSTSPEIVLPRCFFPISLQINTGACRNCDLSIPPSSI